MPNEKMPNEARRVGRFSTLLLVKLATFSLLTGCAPRISELDQAGYYSSTEKNIRKTCEREIYGRGVPIGDSVVYSQSDRRKLVERKLKSNPQVLAAAIKAQSEGKQVAIRNDIDFGAKLERDIKNLDDSLKACEISKGSQYRQKLSKILRKK